MTYRNPLRALAFLAVPVALLLQTPSAMAELSFPAIIGQEIAQANPTQRAPGARTAMQGHRQGQHPDFMQQLGLDETQMQQIKTFKEQGRSQSQALHQQLRAKRQSLMKAMQSPDSGESQALALNHEINALQRQLGELRIKTWFRMRAILTPEQLQKLQQMQQQRMQKMQRRGGGQGGFSGKPDDSRNNQP